MMLFAIACGGALGASLRYMTVQGAARLFGAGFPYGTLTVNVVGSLLMGMAAAYVALRMQGAATPVSAFVMTGVLGGFTTFSAFSLDALTLIEAGRSGAAAVYIGASVLVSVGALFLGMVAMRAVMS